MNRKITMLIVTAGIIGVMLLAGIAGAAVPIEQWNKTFGGTNQDYGNSAKQTSDGGYILVGDTRVGNYGDGSNDALLVKTDKYGTKQWEYSFGGTSDDFANSVAETQDGGYIFVGSTKSIAGPEKEKGWIVKVNKDGIKEWERDVTGSNPYENSSNGFSSIEQTSDGGFILSGYTTSSGGLANQVQVQAWLVKLDKDGKETWNKGYGSNGGYNYYGRAAKQTPDGNYLMAVSSNHPVSWVAKIDSDGNEIGWKEFREQGMLDVAIMDVEPTSDGGYVLTGYQRETFALAWIAKIDSANATTWSKTYGEANTHNAIFSVQQTNDGEYIMAGFRSPTNGSNQTGLVIKADANGSEKWRKAFGETNRNSFQSIEKTQDGGYILGGYTNSGGTGSADAWLVKLSSDANVPAATFNISGFKVNDTNGNNVWEPGEMGIENWNIRLLNATTGTQIASTSTNASGFYEFMNLAPGVYNVTEEMKAGFTPSGATFKVVTIENMDVTDVDFLNHVTVQPAVTNIISGFKINDLNGNGKQDPGENGLPGWNIRLTGIVPETASINMETTTDDKGFYSFKDLPAGKYLVVETLKGGYVPSGPPVLVVNLENGTNSMNNNFMNRPVSSLIPDLSGLFK